LTVTKRPVDPESGITINQDGTLHKSSGSGQITKRAIIPAAEAYELVKKGIAPTEVPNWDRDDPDSNWYINVRKFTTERQAIFLTKLQQYGRIGQAANFAGVSNETINRHRKADPEFDAACRSAEITYHEMVATAILNQALVGQIDRRWDKDGKLLSERTTYETQIRKMIVQRADPSYNDVSKQEVSVVGGAVIVPAPVDGVETWDDVVRRMSGSSANGAERTLTDSERSELGQRALGEGRVVKRSVVDTSGESVGNEGTVEDNEPTDDSERPANK